MNKNNEDTLAKRSGIAVAIILAVDIALGFATYGLAIWANKKIAVTLVPESKEAFNNL